MSRNRHTEWVPLFKFIFELMLVNSIILFHFFHTYYYIVFLSFMVIFKICLSTSLKFYYNTIKIFQGGFLCDHELQFQQTL